MDVGGNQQHFVLLLLGDDQLFPLALLATVLRIPLRTKCQPEDSTLCRRAASFVQGLDDSVDGYIVAAGCRRCRLLAPQSRRAAGLAILPCDTQPLVGLQAPLRIIECQKPLYDRAGGLEIERLQASDAPL